MALTTPVKITVPFCENGNRAVIPIEAPTTTEEANYASYDAGFPPITMIPTEANGIPPRGVDFNGILYDLTTNIQNWNAGVQMRFDEDFCEAIGGYPLGAVLQSDDGKRAYVSVKANNTGNFNTDSTLIGVDWILYGGGGEGGSLRFAVAEGTSEAITANFATPVIDLEDGTLVVVQATAANVTTTPSFAPNGLAAATIVKGANKPLAVGDISGAGYLAMLQYSANYGAWVLQNPATGINVQLDTIPVGSIQMMACNSIPSGWLVCDGSAVSRTEYADLFEKVGTLWGTGDGSTTFNVPNFINRFPEGSATAGTIKSAGLPNITGTFEGNSDDGDDYKTGAFYLKSSEATGANGDSGGGTVGFDASLSNAIYGNSDTVQPNSGTLVFAIKAKNTASNESLARSEIEDIVKSTLSVAWEKLYPVGSVYISDKEVDPGTLFDGEWELVDKVINTKGKQAFTWTNSDWIGGAQSAYTTNTWQVINNILLIDIGVGYESAIDMTTETLVAKIPITGLRNAKEKRCWAGAVGTYGVWGGFVLGGVDDNGYLGVYIKPHKAYDSISMRWFSSHFAVPLGEGVITDNSIFTTEYKYKRVS